MGIGGKTLWLALGVLASFSLVLPQAPSVRTEQEPAAPPPLPRPLEEIVQRFAEKEVEYARAHARYAYRLSIKLQELDGAGSVLGEFTEVLEVSLSPTGRRIGRIVEGPTSSLQHLPITRVELFDLSEVPLFTVRPEDLSLYRFNYVGTQRIDEVDTFVFQAIPTTLPRGKILFEGLLWVDADKLDIVKLFGRSVPARRGGVLKDYFQRVEVYREPVDDHLFPTFIQGDDILRVVDETLRARLILRFFDHQLLSPPAEATPPSP
ncbi:MAG: hypothetical protein ACE5H2_06020 [Terriglobia bacterium]